MKKHFLVWDNPCQAIYMLMAVLMVIGCINVFSASFVTAKDMVGNGLYYFWRYIIFGILGLIGMRVARKIGYKRLLNSKFLFWVYMIVLGMLIVVDVMGVANKGAARWIYLGPISIQPSEFAKLVIIMLCARHLGVLMKKEKEFIPWKGEAGKLLFQTAVYAALVLKQPDLGTAAIIIALMGGMFVLAGMPNKYVFMSLAGGAAASVIAVITTPYRLKRIMVWFDPWLDEAGNGYQMVQSLLAIGSGGLTGTHWGMGAGKFHYLPEAHTDFAFAIFCQENGLVGAVILLFLFLLMGIAFFRITMRTRDRIGFLLASGITFLIIGQAVANMAMVCGLLPVIGVPLIFISYGGSSMVISMIAIGLLLSVYDEEMRLRELDAQSPEVRRDNLRVVDGRRWPR